jgi:hypothetical protein
VCINAIVLRLVYRGNGMSNILIYSSLLCRGGSRCSRITPTNNPLQPHDHGGAFHCPASAATRLTRLGAARVTAAPPPSRGLAARAARPGTAPERAEGARGWAAGQRSERRLPAAEPSYSLSPRPGAGPGSRPRCPTAPLGVLHGAAPLFRPRRHEAELPAAAGVRALQHGLHARPRLLEHEG